MRSNTHLTTIMIGTWLYYFFILFYLCMCYIGSNSNSDEKNNQYVNESKNIRVQDFYLRIRTKFAVVLLHRTKNYMRYLAKIYEKYFPNVIHCKV